MLGKAIRAIHWLEDSVLIVLVAYMVLISLAQIVLRNLGISSIVWADASVRVTVLWLAFFGALRASRQQDHIAIDIMTHYGSVTVRKAIHAITSLLAAAICGIAAWYTASFVHMEYQDGYSAFAEVPAWLCQIIIPIGLATIGVRFILYAFRLPDNRDDNT